jgi:PQQ-like domain
MRSQRKRRLITGLASVAGAALLAMGSPPAPAAGEPMWTTYHRDPGRSGFDTDAGEPIVPVKAWQSPDLGAPIYGQPLVLAQRAYVATVGDRIYALDAASGAVIWEKSAGTPVPSGELPCGNIDPTVGIVGTPVIDTSSNAIYAVADTWDAVKKEAHHVLKGYRLTDGAEVLSTPVDPPGSDPKALLQRTALNLDAGRVIFGMGGNYGDCGQYRGTVVAAPESGGSPLYWQYSPAPPSSSGGAVWGTSGPAVDGAGRIYATTGNPNPSGGKAETYDYSDSVLKLDSALNQIGSFKPPSWLTDSNNDTDLGSSGAELLPGGLLFQAGKNGTGYLIDEAQMGSAAAAVYSHQVCAGHGSYGGDAYAGGVIYIPCTNGVQALAYDQALRTFTVRWQGPSDAVGPPIVSGGLVWSVATGGGGGTKLYGLDPSTGAPRYTETLPSPVADHFASPSAAGGRLLVATGSSVTAFTTLSPLHYYRNGALIGSEPKTVIEWGTLALKTVKGGSGEVTCHTAQASTIDNPVGGGAGVSLTELFATYRCESTTCPFTTVVSAESLPWPSVLEAEGSVIRVKTTGVKVKIDCRKGGKSEASVTFRGAEQPSFNRSGSSALHPSFLEFDAGSGLLEGEGSAGAVQNHTEGWVKLFGYEEQELIRAK